MKKKIKLQVPSKARGPGFPKWIPPEKRMKTYADYGIGDDIVPKSDPRWKKVKWVDFRIVVPDEETKQQLLAAFEYIHDNRTLDLDYIAVNTIAHSYLTPELESGCKDIIVVDPSLFKKLKRK